MYSESVKRTEVPTLKCYKTDAYSGATTSVTTVIANTTLPKGKYIPIVSGYCSLYGGCLAKLDSNNAIVQNVGYIAQINELEVDTETKYGVIAATSGSVTWAVYHVNFIKVD